MSQLENVTLEIRPNSEHPNRICCLHDAYQIWNIVIFSIIVEYKCACKYSVSVLAHCEFICGNLKIC